MVAGQTGTVFIGRGALVTNRHTDSIRVEDPVPGAFKTDLSVPIPGLATKVRGFGVVGS